MRNFTFALLILITSTTFLQAQYLTAFEENGKWGYKDNGNKVVIQPFYDEANSFGHDFAKVKLNGKFGFINKKGKLVVPTVYDNVEWFSGPYSAVMLNGKWGFVDSHGKLKIDCLYDKVYNDYYHGKSSSVLLNNKWGRIDLNGKTIIPFEYDYLAYESEGLISADKNGMIGFINMKNEVVIPFIYTYADDFDNGYVNVSIGDKTGVINKSNQIIVPIEYSIVDRAEGSNFLLPSINDKYEIWSPTEGKKSEAIYNMLPFPVGHIYAVGLDKKWGLIDAKGNQILGVDYDNMIELGYFADYPNLPALIMVEKDGLFGLFDEETKTMVLPIEFSSISTEFSYAYIMQNGKYGLFDLKLKKIVIECNYENIQAEDRGFFSIYNNNLQGLVSSTGKVMLEEKYSYITVGKSYILAVTPDDISQKFNLKGEPIK